MFQSPRHRSARIVALVAGLALSAVADAQMATHQATRIDWLIGQGKTGMGIWIGQMEVGVADQHTAYADRIWEQQPGFTVTGHATRVAGVMVAAPQVYNGQNYRGIATGSRLVSSYANGNSSNYTAGMNYLVNKPIEILNISWGGAADTAGADSTSIIADWAANSKGKLVSVASGNDGNGVAPGTPADGYNVLTVGATGVPVTGGINYRRLATYSNSGLTAGHTSMAGRAKIDLVAPGTGVITTTNDQDNNTNGNLRDDWRVAPQGTSYAAPHVSGAASLIMQHSIAKPWEAAGRDPRTMRAVLINGADKNVYDRNNRRWDDPAATKWFNGLDIDTGAGQLDARRSFETYQGGQVGFNFKSGNIYGVGGTTPNAGWGLDTVASGSVTQWWTDSNIRKGSYVTSTLAWNRETSGATAAAATYDNTLRDLDLTVRRFSDDSVVGTAASALNSVEHVVAKMPARDKIKIEAKNVSGASQTFGVAWHSYAAPTTTRDFNGDFMGDRGALNDNGWFDVSTHGTSSVLRPDFTNQTADASFAMSILPNSMGLPAGMAQELVTPSSGFWLRFDLAFSGSLNSHTLGIQLGGVDILTAAGIANGLIVPEAANTGQYKTYTIDLANNQGIFAGLTGGFQDLSFLGVGYGGGRINIDNITYVPTTGTLALMGMGLLVAARRRR